MPDRGFLRKISGTHSIKVRSLVKWSSIVFECKAIITVNETKMAAMLS